ncbi:septum formation protein [Catenibacillus scindens]|uniref:dTTP/UTP pyrophosphatase n=1 Tax=Catenibacillus scindens TaxID=673271 RepID=A0A7W8M409_9FIRM|nr:septum formation protein [Catenibacillus scindens]
MKIILASASPRRRELLSQGGLEFLVIPSQVEEHMEGDTPQQVVMSLARQKAEDVFDKIKADYLQKSGERFVVLGADTIVVCDGKLLGKPSGPKEAFDMLKLLSGRSHQVYTGVCLCAAGDGDICRDVFFGCTTVSMYPISDAQARWYVDSGEPLDKAGSYAIQGLGGVFIKEIQGDYNNVVGLPLSLVWHHLDDMGMLSELKAGPGAAGIKTEEYRGDKGKDTNDEIDRNEQAGSET